jgi:multisubunit Na+/H+ antiporter MnhG subunit
MAGSVLFGVLFVVVVLLILLGIASPIWLVPLVVIGLGLLLLTPFLAKLRGSAIAQPDSAPQGVPTTREASYEPVQDPADRPT